MKKFQLFDQHHGLSTLQKLQLWLLFKYMYKVSRKACFKREGDQIIFLGVFCIKRNVNKITNFWPKPWTNPFGKMRILWVFKPTFSLFRNACLLYKTSKIVFSRFIFRFYDMGIQGLHRVTRGYKGWQGVTRAVSYTHLTLPTIYSV